jgi:hypothetical protein
VTLGGWSLLPVLAALLAAAPALAQPAAKPPREGTILFTRFDGVFQQPADLSQPAVQLVELPDDASEVRWLEPIRDGRLVVLDFGDYASWLYAPDPTKPVELRGGGCVGRARPNPYGGCLVCVGQNGVKLVAAGRDDWAPLPGTLDDVAFLGDSGYDLGARAPEGIIGFDRRDPTKTRVLATPGARSHLLLSPDGKRGVAVFGEGEAARVRSFLLDGEGISRQLGGPGFPTVWSWDSTWVLFQEGDIKDADKAEEGGEEARAADADGETFMVAVAQRRSTKKRPRPRRKSPEQQPVAPLIRACVARAVGGEVKCWDRYTGLAFSPDSTLVLLRRDRSLYVGKIAGVRPDPPVKIIDDVDGAATWVPGPIGVPPPPAPPGVDSAE